MNKRPRRQNFQTIAWFYDLHNRELLDLDPPYQRRSVWNQSYKDYFVDTILLNYPAPTIFLYEEIDDFGSQKFHVVDGKQRLTTIFEFIKGEFPVGDKVDYSKLRGKFFDELSREEKTAFYSYTFSVEYLPIKDESIINNIFDRINRNVAKLTSQELRHAKYSGEFITTAEELTSWMFEHLPKYFPQIANKSKKQMKDVELVAQILLRFEESPKGYNSEELDKAFSDRDEEWEFKDIAVERFKESILFIERLCSTDNQSIVTRSRFRNQADFYTLIGVISELQEEKKLPAPDLMIDTLQAFIALEKEENIHTEIADYYGYIKSASNRTKARKERERILKNYILGQYD